MIEGTIFGFLVGCVISGFACFHLGYEQRIYDTREITAAKDAKLEAYESMLGIMKVKKELH
jgi:hypothetical protein